MRASMFLVTVAGLLLLPVAVAAQVFGPDGRRTDEPKLRPVHTYEDCIARNTKTIFKGFKRAPTAAEAHPFCAEHPRKAAKGKAKAQ